MNVFTCEQQALLQLLRRSLWGGDLTLPAKIDWQQLGDMAHAQGVTAFLYDGVMAAPEETPQALLETWRRKTFGGVARNQRLLAAQDAVCGWLAQAGIPAAVLKGASIARCYPKPDLRILGDIDILVAEADLERAGEILLQNGFAAHGADHSFHRGFSRSGVCVELHYAVTNLPDSPGGRATEAITAGFLARRESTSLEEHQFPALSAQDQHLALLLHMVRHMFEKGIGLRQLCDWGVTVATGAPEVLASTALMLKNCGLLRYAAVATWACVAYLGLPAHKASWCPKPDQALCRRFLEDIFRGGSMGEADREGMGSFLTDNSAMGRKQSALKSFFIRLTRRGYRLFPVTQKCKLLVPVFWVVMPIQYLCQSLRGRQPKRSVGKMLSLAKQSRSLYRELKMFDLEPEKTDHN